MSSNIRKQFQRVAQRLDQGLGRVEKSQVLNEEQQHVERRVDQLRLACQNVSKKVQSCLSSQGKPIDTDKRLRKLPQSALAQCMLDTAAQLGANTCSGQVMLLCGSVEERISKELVELESATEENVLRPLMTILDDDIPAIDKLRRQLDTRTLDMDAAKNRLAAVLKQAQQGSIPPSKVDQAREDVEDAMAKMEQTRDQLATDMYTFVGRETDLSHCILELARAEVDYHRRSLEMLEQLVPQLEEAVESNAPQPLFGMELRSHLERSCREIASVLEDCVTALLEYGMDEEGVFRLAGSASKVKKLKSALNSNSGPVTICSEEYDAHVVATVLKQYLRELPEPLMTFDLYSDWVDALKAPADQKVSVLANVVAKMPRAYRANLRYLIKFLARLTEYSDINKMTSANIGLVIGPNLLWPEGDSGPNMLASGLQSSVVDLLVSNADVLFPDGESERSGSSPSMSTPHRVDSLPSTSSVTVPARPTSTILTSASLHPADPIHAPNPADTHPVSSDAAVSGSPVNPNVLRRVSKKVIN